MRWLQNRLAPRRFRFVLPNSLAAVGLADHAAVVAQDDDAGGVDGVVAHPVVRRDLVAGGEGFGPVVERLDGCGAAQRPVWANAVVVGLECVDLVLQRGDGRRRG